MKPREFDELVRQKFDQDDFAYNPANWDRLAEELDGRTKKRTLLVWWMPLVGVAASVAIALGASTVLQRGTGIRIPATQPVAMVERAHTQPQPATAGTSANSLNSDINTPDNTAAHKAATLVAKEDNSSWFAIRYDNIKDAEPVAHTKNNRKLEAELAFASGDESKNQKAKPAANNPGYYTFKKEEQRVAKAPAKTAILITGGVNRGGQSSGYSVGASARHMVTDKVFIEGDIAFVGTSNSTQKEYLDMTPPASNGSSSNMAAMSRSTARGINAKNASTNEKPTSVPYAGTIKTATESYNLYYAQVTPSIGYKIIKHMSVGIGPDFQQMIVDNRPAASTVDRNTIKTDPIFDVGVVGKTEYAVTRNIKAAVYYREGINNVLTPMGKYIDRYYVQFQVKCAIFNK